MALITAALDAGSNARCDRTGAVLQHGRAGPPDPDLPSGRGQRLSTRFPDRAEAVRQTLAYYDLRAFAPRLSATTLLMAGAPGTLLDAPTLEPIVRAIQGPVTVHASEQSNYKDGLYTEQWMAAQCGIADVHNILPEHWR